MLLKLYSLKKDLQLLITEVLNWSLFRWYDLHVLRFNFGYIAETTCMGVVKQGQ